MTRYKLHFIIGSLIFICIAATLYVRNTNNTTKPQILDGEWGQYVNVLKQTDLFDHSKPLGLDNLPEYLVFEQDGKVKMMLSGDSGVIGEYRVVDGGQIIINLHQQSVMYTFQISDGNLFLQNNKHSYVYARTNIPRFE